MKVFPLSTVQTFGASLPPTPCLLQSRSDLNLCVWSNTSRHQNIHNCWMEAKMKETQALSEHTVLKVFDGDVLLG